MLIFLQTQIFFFFFLFEKAPFKHRENIEQFGKLLQSKGLPTPAVFTATDLYDNKNFLAVLKTIKV